MADKFKKGDIVKFKIGEHTLFGTILKPFHSRNKKEPTAYLIMTDYQIMDEDKLTLEDWKK